MEKKVVTVQELIDQLSEIKEKNVPVCISMGANMEKLMEGDILSIKNLNAVVAEENGKHEVVGVNIITHDTVENELAQCLKTLSPTYAYSRVATAFTRFLTGKGFANFCNNGGIIMTSVKKHLGVKLSEADAKKLKDIRDLANKILGEDAPAEEEKKDE